MSFGEALPVRNSVCQKIQVEFLFSDIWMFSRRMFFRSPDPHFRCTSDTSLRRKSRIVWRRECLVINYLRVIPRWKFYTHIHLHTYIHTYPSRRHVETRKPRKKKWPRNMTILVCIIESNKFRRNIVRSIRESSRCIPFFRDRRCRTAYVRRSKITMRLNAFTYSLGQSFPNFYGSRPIFQKQTEIWMKNIVLLFLNFLLNI